MINFHPSESPVETDAQAGVANIDLNGIEDTIVETEQIGVMLGDNTQVERRISKLTQVTKDRIDYELTKMRGGLPAASALYLDEQHFVKSPEYCRDRTRIALGHLSSLGFVAEMRPENPYSASIKGTLRKIEYTFWNLGKMTIAHRVPVVALMKDMREFEPATDETIGMSRQILLINSDMPKHLLEDPLYGISDETYAKAMSFAQDQAA
jgi:hypothetical protein